MGAVYLQNGVCMLPKSDDYVRRLKMLENDITEMGGEFRPARKPSRSIEAQEEKVIARFRGRSRRAVPRVHRPLRRLRSGDRQGDRDRGSSPFAELEEEDTDLKKLQGWLEKIRKLDRSTGRRWRGTPPARLPGVRGTCWTATPSASSMPTTKIDDCAGPRGSHGVRRVPAWASRALGFVSLFMDVSSEMIHALLPVYLVTGLGTSALTIGVIEGIGEATASVVKIFSGALSDWFGRRKLLLVLGYGLGALFKTAVPPGDVGIAGPGAHASWIASARAFGARRATRSSGISLRRG